jgi:hypothetical protein
VHQVEQLTGLAHSTVSKFYTVVRARIHRYMTSNPISFSDDEIVEIDELYLKPLKGEMNEFEEREAWKPVIGLIGRKSGAVALEIAPDHRYSTAAMQDVIESHLPSADARTIADEHKSFDDLTRQHEHNTRPPLGSRSGVGHGNAAAPDDIQFPVYSADDSPQVDSSRQTKPRKESRPRP